MATANNLSPELFGATFLNAASRDGTRPSAATILRSIKKAVDANDWRTTVSISRKLYANMGVPRGAINLKAMLSVGEAWDPIYLGENTAWGEEAKSWLLDEFYPMGNVRGPLFDFKTDTYLDSVTLDRCGDYLYLLTASQTGFPQVQAIPNHLVKSPFGIRNGASSDILVKVPRHLVDGYDADLSKGPVLRTLTAASVYNGVAYNSSGRPFAYCVFEEATEVFREVLPVFQWVHEQYICHIFDPEWYEQGRGFPAFSHAVKQFMSMLTSQEFEEITHMIMSSISLEEHNEEGTSNPLDPTSTIGTKSLKENLAAASEGEIPEVTMEQIVGGVIRYFKAGSGAKISTPMRSSPGPIWDAFQDRLVRIALTGVNMPYSIVWKGDDENGTSNRVSIEKVQRVVLDRQGLLSVSGLRKIRYGLCVAMNTGRVPKNKVDWSNWGFSLPPEFIIDDGRIAKSDREDYVMGHQNLTGILARRGQRLIPHLTERAEEEAQKQIAAIEITKKYAAQGVFVTPDMLGTTRVTAAAGGQIEEPGDGTTPPGEKKPAKKGPATD